MTENHQQKMTWTVEKTHPELMEPLREALSKVIDPEIGMNVVELGLIRDVVIKDNEPALVTMVMTTPYCPYAPALLEMTRQQAELGLKQTTVVEFSLEPWDPSMMEENAAADWGLF